MEPKITDFISGKVIYDNQRFWIECKANGIRLLGELRGWGHIQHMKQFYNKGKIDMGLADKFHDDVGQFVADAINEKIKRNL